MNKVIIFIIFSILFHFTSFAQNDSLTFISAKWKTTKIARGVILRQFSFQNNLFSSNQTISILEIKAKKKYSFAIGYATNNLKTTSEFGNNANTIAALNGTFFDTKTGVSVDYLKSNNQIISQNKMVDSVRTFHQKAAIVFHKNVLSIEKWNNSTSWEASLESENIMVSGPLLIFKQQNENLDISPFSANRHPRSAIAKINSNTILFVAVDGRNQNAAGMSLLELQNIMSWLSVSEAINLDGGGSTTLWIKGKPNGGVVNYPSDNKKWDHYGERKVANALLLNIN